MIDPGFCVTMARYNAWQNRQLSDQLQDLSIEELTQDRGAFFGSILSTVNHILWGDQIWMSRFDSGALPKVDAFGGTTLHSTLDPWKADRVQTDARIRRWADALNESDLAGTLTWMSGATGRQERKPRAECIVHLFNHQTHHRGQVHAMLTATGRKAPVSDLVFMPEDS